MVAIVLRCCKHPMKWGALVLSAGPVGKDFFLYVRNLLLYQKRECGILKINMQQLSLDPIIYIFFICSEQLIYIYFLFSR